MYIAYMVRWNEEKRAKILENRGIDLEDVATLIESGEFRIADSPNQEGHPGQKMFVVVIEDYAVCAPFVRDENGDFFLKTAFPSRMMQKQLKGGVIK